MLKSCFLLNGQQWGEFIDTCQGYFQDCLTYDVFILNRTFATVKWLKLTYGDPGIHCISKPHFFLSKYIFVIFKEAIPLCSLPDTSYLFRRSKHGFSLMQIVSFYSFATCLNRCLGQPTGMSKHKSYNGRIGPASWSIQRNLSVISKQSNTTIYLIY